MKESTVVRENLMNEPGYTPYCGAAMKPVGRQCTMPRMAWNPDLNQFKCPHCGFVTEFPADFITRYKAKWNK